MDGMTPNPKPKVKENYIIIIIKWPKRDIKEKKKMISKISEISEATFQFFIYSVFISYFNLQQKCVPNVLFHSMHIYSNYECFF